MPSLLLLQHQPHVLATLAGQLEFRGRMSLAATSKGLLAAARQGSAREGTSWWSATRVELGNEKQMAGFQAWLQLRRPAIRDLTLNGWRKVHMPLLPILPPCEYAGQPARLLACMH